MSPERADEIIDAAPERMCIRDIVLLACAEERRAALTEAANIGRSYSNPIARSAYDDGYQCAARNIAEAIERLRDANP